MSDPIHTEEAHGCTIKVFPDEATETPRDWDNLGTMICFHRRYNLGDKHEMSVEEAQALSRRKDVIALPLYLYDHSGLAMSTSNAGYPFNCPWDAGCVGFIYVTREKIRKEYDCKRVTKAILEKVIKCLQGEVTCYHQYLSGSVYGYVVEDAEGNQVDSCWGYYGDYDDEYMMYEARQAAKAFAESAAVAPSM